MAGSTFIQVPSNITDGQTLKRFLDKLVLQLDIAFGNRGTNSFATTENVFSNIVSINQLIEAINAEALKYSKLDGSREYTAIVSYNSDKTFTDDKELIAKKYADDTFEPIIATKGTAFNKDFGTTTGTVTEGGTTTNNPTQAAIANLGLTISNPPTQAEVQAVSNKVDAILSAIRNSNIISI